MTICKSIEELKNVNDNKVIGAENLNMNNSEIRFNGSGNILYVEENVNLSGSRINFQSDNSLVYLSSSGNAYCLNLSIHYGSTLYIGNNNYMNGKLNITISEHTNIFLGDDNLFAFGIWLRTADPHLIYSVETKKRINPSKSVFIGDHIWIGQDACIFKGTQISSGSILGACSVCPGKRIPSNESWAGNPAHKISEGIFWERPSCHNFTEKDTKEHSKMHNTENIFEYNESEYVSFDSIDEKLSSLKTPEKRLEYFIDLRDKKTKNRFAFKEPVQKVKHGLFHR